MSTRSGVTTEHGTAPVLLELSAAQGPVECALAVSHALQRLLRECRSAGVQVQILERQPGPVSGSLQSVLLALDGEHAATLAMRWQGSMLWTCQSPLRPRHPRKNWFFGGAVYRPSRVAADAALRIETLRASGPGGQHVNKTESAVRVTHLASGLSVTAQSERSQHANRRAALALLDLRLEQQAHARQASLKAQRRLFHHQVDRGNPHRCFIGPDFIERTTN